MSELETAIQRWPSLTLCVVSYVIGGVVGALLIAWIMANDSHTGVGMGGFFLGLMIMVLAGAAAAIGSVLLIFRRTRERGVTLLAVGAGTLTAFVLRLITW